MAMSTMRQAPAGSDDQDPLRALLKQAQQLFPSWQDPRKFHEGKSSLIAGLRQLIDSGDGAPGRRRARTSAPPTPAPEPLPRRRQPVVAPASAPPLVVTLPLDRFELLLSLATRPTHRSDPCFQTRFQRWADGIDVEARTVALSASDTLWVRKMMVDKNRGGFQHHLWKIFEGTHSRFANLPIRPAPKRPGRKYKSRRERAEERARNHATSAQSLRP
jgi:hypothetical protein